MLLGAALCQRNTHPLLLLHERIPFASQVAKVGTGLPRTLEHFLQAGLRLDQRREVRPQPLAVVVGFSGADVHDLSPHARLLGTNAPHPARPQPLAARGGPLL